MLVPYKEVCDIDTNVLNSILQSITEQDWVTEDYRKTVGNMTSTNSIPIMHTTLCASGYMNDTPIHSIKPGILFDKYITLIQPVLEQLASVYKYDKYACFLSRLYPHSAIGEHIDTGNFLTKCHRIHVPIKTNPDVSYKINGIEYFWPAGKIYEFDNTLRHGVINRSDEERIHLVVNLYPKDEV
jgi:hypothetical protein